jgi:hypothetical protein
MLYGKLQWSLLMTTGQQQGKIESILDKKSA